MRLHICFSCGALLPVNVFPWRDKVKRYRRWDCKKCCAAYSLQWLQKRGAGFWERRKKVAAQWHKKKGAEYAVWLAMKQRCNNARCVTYHNYGGRGIKVCERWNKFENFIADMGKRPSAEHSLDRIDNNGNYTPKNCRWVTFVEQLCNTRRNRVTYEQVREIRRRYAADKVYGSCARIARSMGVPQQVVWYVAKRRTWKHVEG